MNKTKPLQFVNPFSESFLDYWNIWKNFKKEEWGFEYRGVTSQQMAVKQLVDLSEGDEERAIKILCQSVRRRWQGFWPLHETTTGGTKNAKQSTPKEGEPSLREQAAAEFNRRNGNGGQQTDGSHLKVV